MQKFRNALKDVFRLVVAAGFIAAGVSARGGNAQPAGISQARADYLQAMLLADEGSRPEALHLLAESLRLQAGGNPASALAFELLTELRTNSCLLLRGHKGGILYAAYSPDGTKIVTASEDHTARIWDARTGLQIGPALQHDDDVNTAEFSADGTRVVTASDDKTARIWDVKTGKLLVTMKEPHELHSATFSPNGMYVGVAAEEGHSGVWDAKTGALVSQPPVGHGDVFEINFSPDSSRMIIANADGVCPILDVKTAKPLLPPIRHKNNIMTAVYSPDGTCILTASADRTARIWDAKTAKPLGPVFHHGNWVWMAAFNGEATQVVTASWDHTARVWDAKTGEPVTPPLQHADAVTRAVFSPDGKLVATASRDHTARVWDAATGDPLTLPLRAGDEVTTAIFSRDGKSLLVTSKDGTARVWDMPPLEKAPPWLADLADFAWTQVSYDTSREAQLEAITALRGKLLASKSDEPWEKFGRWYFTDTETRPISPWSTVTLKEYVDELIKLGDRDSLDYAISLSQKIPAWMVKLVPLRAKLGAPAASATPAKDND